MAGAGQGGPILSQRVGALMRHWRRDDGSRSRGSCFDKRSGPHPAPLRVFALSLDTLKSGSGERSPGLSAPLATHAAPSRAKLCQAATRCTQPCQAPRLGGPARQRAGQAPPAEGKQFPSAFPALVSRLCRAVRRCGPRRPAGGWRPQRAVARERCGLALLAPTHGCLKLGRVAVLRGPQPFPSHMPPCW